MNNIVELKDISKSFSINKKISVLKKLSYKFNPGKICSLMGVTSLEAGVMVMLIVFPTNAVGAKDSRESLPV